MSLREQQALFVQLVGRLIGWAYLNGFELTFGEAWRTPEQALLNAQHGKGIKNSLHIDRLAIDFNLFLDGRFLDSGESHRPLGTYWKGLHPLCRWGGDFGDGNHYSMEFEGRK